MSMNWLACQYRKNKSTAELVGMILKLELKFAHTDTFTNNTVWCSLTLPHSAKFLHVETDVTSCQHSKSPYPTWANFSATGPQILAVEANSNPKCLSPGCKDAQWDSLTGSAEFKNKQKQNKNPTIKRSHFLKPVSCADVYKKCRPCIIL